MSTIYRSRFESIYFDNEEDRNAYDNAFIKSTGQEIMKEHNSVFTKLAKHDTSPKMTLPIDSSERKNHPLLSGCIKYFPAALAGVANVSKKGNDKHNPGQPLHHARGKSMDHGDCIIRHLVDVEDLLAAYKRGNKNVTKEMILLEANQMAWRALAYSQLLHEEIGLSPMAPGAKLEKDETNGSS